MGDPPAKYVLGAFNPLDYLPAISTTSIPCMITPSVTPDIILFVGSPASGKSTFYRTNLAPMGYERINQDSLKSLDKCLSTAKSLLLENKPLAIDNTNAEKATRQKWIDLAKTHGREIRCVHFTTSAQLAKHNNWVRALGGTAKVTIKGRY